MTIVEKLTEDDIAAIRAVQYCCSTDEARPQLLCVQLCDGWALGTDSYRMAFAELPDFAVSPVPKWVSPVALPDDGPCRLEYELDGDVTRTVAIGGRKWPLYEMRTLNGWGNVTGCLTGRIPLSVDGRAGVVAAIKVLWKSKQLGRGDPIAVSRAFKAIKLSAPKGAEVEIGERALPSEMLRPRMPMVFNSRYFVDLLTAAPAGPVELQFHGTRKDNVVVYGNGPVVIHADDEIHALMPIRVNYTVEWDPVWLD